MKEVLGWDKNEGEGRKWDESLTSRMHGDGAGGRGAGVGQGAEQDRLELVL